MLEKDQDKRISWLELEKHELFQVDSNSLHNNEMLIIHNKSKAYLGSATHPPCWTPSTSKRPRVSL